LAPTGRGCDADELEAAAELGIGRTSLASRVQTLKAKG